MARKTNLEYDPTPEKGGTNRFNPSERWSWKQAVRGAIYGIAVASLAGIALGELNTPSTPRDLLATIECITFVGAITGAYLNARRNQSNHHS